MRYLAFAIIIVFTFHSCKEHKETTQSDMTLNRPQDSLTIHLEQLHAKGVINGFGVAIVTQDSVVYQKGFGVADAEKNIPYTKHTIQNIASISKTFIGIALMKAQELNMLSLDDPISKHLDFEVKNPNFPDQMITIRHLATHTSSITDGAIYGEKSYILKSPLDSNAIKLMEVPKEFNPPSQRITMKTFLYNVLDEKGSWYSKKNYLNKPPGELFEYTNVGATLAAQVIESATGEDFNTFTTKHILEPLGMSSSGWSFDDVDFSKHTKLYADKSTQIPFYSLITYPDGGFITSIEDLSLYVIELIRGYSNKGTLLNNKSYKEFFKPQLSEEHFKERDPDNPYNDEYDFGIFIGLSAKDYIGHTGGDPGVSSFLFFNTKDKIGRMLLINTDLTNEKGVQQFFSIWDALEAYQWKIINQDQ